MTMRQDSTMACGHVKAARLSSKEVYKVLIGQWITSAQQPTHAL